MQPLQWLYMSTRVTKLLAAHNDVRTSVALAQSDCNLGHCSLTVSVEKLCTVLDNCIVFLTCTRKESWNINKRYDRNIESIAETYEACRLPTSSS